MSPPFIIPTLVLIVTSFGAKFGTVFLSLRSQDANKKGIYKVGFGLIAYQSELALVTVKVSVDLTSASADMLSIEGARL